nr:UDP-glycosyltransferase UGT5-like [Cherax quadricarinatus]
MGRTVQGSVMPDKYRMVFLEVFASLEQRVLWKWETETMEGLPSNVRLAKWLPQQDILGDPRLRLFITHGGLLSSQEATYHGVPILGIPVFADQQHNMRNSQREGWARTMTWDDLSYDLLRQNILQIISDTKLRQESERRSAVMRDQPMTPAEWTVYWAEYVIRHRGATHLRSPFFTMPWYEVYNVDVWLLLTVVTVLIICLFCWIVHTVASRFCFPSVKHKQE